MEQESCKVCGYRSQLGAIEKHHIVPTEVTEQAGLPASQIIRVCCNCHREVHTWCSIRVSNMAYDPRSKRFRAKAWLEIVEEWRSAYQSFVTYKREYQKGPGCHQES